MFYLWEPAPARVVFIAPITFFKALTKLFLSMFMFLVPPTPEAVLDGVMTLQKMIKDRTPRPWKDNWKSPYLTGGIQAGTPAEITAATLKIQAGKN